MREQVQRLNKRPGVETQAGQLATGVTGNVQMGYVQQEKTSGQRLAETFGMLVEGGSKVAAQGVELYEGQKKEEAANRVATEQFQWMDEMNNLGSDSERVQYIQEKVKGVSNEGVDKYYRNMAIGFFDNYYNTYSKGATIEKNNAVGKIMTNEMMATMLSDGKMDYNEVTSRYSHLPKAYYHTAYQTALKGFMQSKFMSVRTKEDLDAVTAETDTLISEYSNNTYAGGSKSVEAVNLKADLMKTYKAYNSGFNAKFKENYKSELTINEVDMSITPDAYNKKVSNGVNNGFLTKGAAYKKQKDYEVKYAAKQETNLQIEEYDPDADNNKRLENDEYTADAKKYIEESAMKNFEVAYSNNNIPLAIERVMNNEKILMPVVKGLLAPTGDPKADNEAIQLFAKLKTTEDGNYILNKMPAKDKAFLDAVTIASKSGKVNYTQMYDAANSTENPYVSPADRKKLSKSYAGVPSGMKDGLIAYSDILLKMGMPMSDVVSHVKESVESNTINLGKFNPLKDNIDLINFHSSNIKITDSLGDIVQDFGEKHNFPADATNVYYDEARDEMIFYEKGNFAIPLKIVPAQEFKDYKEKYDAADLKGKLGKNYQETQEALAEKKALRNSFKNPYYDDFDESPLGQIVNKVLSNTTDFGDVKIDKEAFDKTNLGQILNRMGLRADELTPENIAELSKQAQEVQKELGVKDESLLKAFQELDMGKTKLQRVKESLMSKNGFKEASKNYDLKNMTEDEKVIALKNIFEQMGDDSENELGVKELNLGNTTTGKIQELFSNVSTEQTEVPTKDIPKEEIKGNAIVNQVYKVLPKFEGASGDNTGGPKTLKWGMTEKKYKDIKTKYKNPDLSVEEVIGLHLNELHTAWKKKEGFNEGSSNLQKALTYATYNLGKGAKDYKGLTRELKKLKNNKDESKTQELETAVLKQLLDTANIKGYTSKGLANSRAKIYNMVAKDKIKYVTQKADGTLDYKNADKDIIFSYNIRGGKGVHASSKVGTIEIKE